MAYVGRFDGSEAKHASPAMAAQSGHAAGADSDPSALPTSTKWSVLSSRVEGLVAELSQVVGKQDAYCVEQSKAEGPVMAAIREKMLSTDWGEEWEKKRTMFSYGEEMSTDPLEAMLLKQFAFMTKPRRILEVGMFAGYGSAAMLEGAPHTQVVSLDIDPYLKEWVGSCLAQFPDCARRHEVVVGPALDSLKIVTGEFDMIFVDANKAEYKAYVELILERGLLSREGILINDNVLYNGYPYVHNHFDSQPKRRCFGNAIKEFNQWIRDHPQLEQVVLPIRDGVSLVRRKPFAPPSRAPATAAFVPGVTDYYTFPPAPYAMIVDIALREKGINTEGIAAYERFIDLPNLENRCEEILKMNPHGTVPFFKMEDGSFINETSAMTEYLDEVVPGSASLVGRTAQERATVRMWQSRMEEHYIIPAFYGHRNWTSSDDCPEDHFMRGFFSKRLNKEHGSLMIPQAWKQWCEWAKNRILWLDQQKQKEASGNGGKASDYIAGDFISAADIRVYVCLWFFSEAFPYPPQMILQDLKGQVPWAQAWYDRVHSRPAVVAAREYRERSLAAYEARKEKGEKAPNAALP
jgi:caffeoyl-CoA O-methyltransferase